ncbi:Zinc finger BED domain-containing protein DAYSLEEPER [Glycine max]|nr:Zinc finger BED domain-containing protein DAYSLEEPER [Glycine max]
MQDILKVHLIYKTVCCVVSLVMHFIELEKVLSMLKDQMIKFKDCMQEIGIESSVGLRLDMPTKWNSTYLMLESALKYEKAFDILREYNDVLSFGTILDSCFKLKFLFFCYTKFDKSTSKNNIGDVNKKFEKLYEEYEFKKFQNEPKSKFGKSELDVYLEEKTFNYDDYYDLDALGHWKTSKNIFLTLATIIRDILSIPITIVATKSTFDIGGCVLTKY